jgi:hypothetical protein
MHLRPALDLLLRAGESVERVRLSSSWLSAWISKSSHIRHCEESGADEAILLYVM